MPYFKLNIAYTSLRDDTLFWGIGFFPNTLKDNTIPRNNLLETIDSPSSATHVPRQVVTQPWLSQGVYQWPYRLNILIIFWKLTEYQPSGEGGAR